MKVRAILFDMDGVLIDATNWHYEALNKALGLFGIEISKYDHLRTFDGLPTKVKLEMLSKQFFLPKELHSFISQIKQQYTLEMIHTRCKPKFHHEYALARLHREGYKIAVCSNSIRSTIETMMQHAGLKEYIDLIVSNEDVKKAKPDPEMYVYAINEFSLKPQECIVVEDNPNGVKAGIDSGASVLRVSAIGDVNYKNIQSKIRECERDG